MMTDPTATDVINPELETVAIAVLLDDHERVLLAALEGRTVAVICCVCDTVMETVAGLTVILKIRMGAIAVAKYDARVVPRMEPFPVQLSYPGPAAYPPFEPVRIS